MIRTLLYGAPLAAALLAGCAPESGRPARIVAASSPLDARLSCEHLQGEYAMNQRRLTEIRGAERGRESANLGRALAYGAFAGGLTRDDGRRAAAEGASLDARDERLRALAAARGCVL